MAASFTVHILKKIQYSKRICLHLQNSVVFNWYPIIMQQWTYLLHCNLSDAISKRESASSGLPWNKRKPRSTGTRRPLYCPSKRSRLRTRAPGLFPNSGISTWKKVVFTLVPSLYRTQAPWMKATKCERRLNQNFVPCTLSSSFPARSSFLIFPSFVFKLLPRLAILLWDKSSSTRFDKAFNTKVKSINENNTYVECFTWRHGGHIGVPKQWNGSHVGVPNQSCGS